MGITLRRYLGTAGRWALAAALVLASGVLSPAPPARAATLTVTTNADERNANGQCSLREAIINANSDSQSGSTDCAAGLGADTINFAASINGAPITLTRTGAGENAADTGDLDLTGNLTIAGNGAANTIIDGNGTDRVIDAMSGATVTLSNLTVRNGSIANDNGGGVLSFAALTLSGIVVQGNATPGFAAGGGIAQFTGSLNVVNSTIRNNTSGDIGGGGLYVVSAAVTVNGSTFRNNGVSGTGVGGAILNDSGGTVNMTNSTVSDNSADQGGGVYNIGNTVDIASSTISNNAGATSGGGLQRAANIQIRNVVLANNTAPSGPDCAGGANILLNGYSVISNDTGCMLFEFSNPGTNARNVAALLGSLQNNGGPTDTRALLAGSPAINRGDSACPPADQRGVARSDGACDSGAYEDPTVLPPTPTNPPPPGPTSTPITPPPGPTSPPGGNPGPQPTPAGVRPVGGAGGAFQCSDWLVTIPPGAVPDGGGIECGSYDPSFAPGAPAGYQLLRRTININLYHPSGSQIITATHPLTLCAPYSAAELNTAGNSPASFRILTASIGGTWTTLTTTADTVARRACAISARPRLFELSVTGSGSGQIYVVQAGDNLFRIALRYGTTVSAIQTANGLWGTLIYPGQRLRIPGPGGAPPPRSTGQVYHVKTGDNLFRLALNFGTTVSALQAANGLVGTRIYVGQVLIVPGGGAPLPAASPTPGSQAFVLHRVQTGENLFRLALRYNTTVAALQAANGLASVTIYVGQVLRIPTP